MLDLTDPSLTVTYHRLIRFLADGTMLSLLSTEQCGLRLSSQVFVDFIC